MHAHDQAVRVERFQHKVWQFERLTEVRHGLAVHGYGHPIVKQICEVNGWIFEDINLEECGPIETRSEILFGTPENKSGLFVDLLNRCLLGDLAEKPGIKILQLSGPEAQFVGDWLTPLNTLLDDNKSLSTSWGEKIPLPADVRVVINIAGNGTKNPAFNSRLGWVFFTMEE